FAGLWSLSCGPVAGPLFFIVLRAMPDDRHHAWPDRRISHPRAPRSALPLQLSAVGAIAAHPQPIPFDAPSQRTRLLRSVLAFTLIKRWKWFHETEHVREALRSCDREI